MQKLKKNLKNSYFKISRYRKTYKNHSIFLYNPISFFLKKDTLKFLNLNIKIKQNNVFCSLIDVKNLKFLLTTSSGKEKISTSKKRLFFSVKYILNSFLKKIKSHVQKLDINFKIKIIAPLRIKILILKLLKKKFIFYKKNIIIDFKSNKCFNGCKPAKKKRKKRKGFVIFK